MSSLCAGSTVWGKLWWRSAIGYKGDTFKRKTITFKRNIIWLPLHSCPLDSVCSHPFPAVSSRFQPFPAVSTSAGVHSTDRDRLHSVGPKGPPSHRVFFLTKPSKLTPVPASAPQAAPRAKKVSPELGLKGHTSPIQGCVQPVCWLDGLGQTLVAEAIGRPPAEIQRPNLRRPEKNRISEWCFLERTNGCSSSRR